MFFTKRKTYEGCLFCGVRGPAIFNLYKPLLKLVSGETLSLTLLPWPKLYWPPHQPCGCLVWLKMWCHRICLKKWTPNLSKSHKAKVEVSHTNFTLLSSDSLSFPPPCAPLHVVGMLRFASDINQPNLPAPLKKNKFCCCVFKALSTVFHSINSPDNSPFSDSVLPVSLPYWSFQLYISLWKSPAALI